MAAMMVAGILLVAACGGSDDAGSPSASVQTTAALEAPAPTTPLDQTTTAESGSGPAAPPGDGEVIFGTSLTPNNLDPHKTLHSSNCLQLCLIYDRLILISPDGTLGPGLADSWSFSEDGLSFTLQIHSGVTFSDGTVLDANGVKANLDRARSLEESAVKNDLRLVESIQTPDESTVELVLSSPQATLPGILSGLAGAMINPSALEDGTDLSVTPDGSGPYELVAYVEGSELVYRRKEEYWTDLPSLAEITIKMIAEPAALTNALLAGQVDIASIAPQNLAPFKGNSDFVEKTITTLYQGAMITNFELAGITDERVRQAFLHAIDREAICETLLGGYCVVSDQPFPPGYFAADNSLDQILYPYDPDEARRLLADAGVTNLHTRAVVGGAPVMPIAEAIQAQLQEVGITLDVELVGPAMTQLVFVDQTAPMVITTFGGRPDPGQFFGVRYDENGFYNPGGFTPPQLQTLINEQLETTDETERLPMLQAVSREVAESAIGMMLYFPTDIFVMRQGVDIELFVHGVHELRTVTVTE